MTDEPLLKRLADELEALTGFLEAHHFDIQPIVELVTEARAAISAMEAEDEDEMVRDVQAWLRDNPPDSRERRALKRLFDACKYHDPDDWKGEPAMIEAAQVLGEPPFGAQP